MSDDFLSQEEIDALLGNKSALEEEYTLGDTEKDIIGEVGNISMSTAATTLSSILNKKVLITTPRVSWIPLQKIIDECTIPKVVATIEFKSGLKGDNMLMMDVRDATIIADLMMGGDGSNAAETLSELELSAVAEAMNQMIGSASTSMATMLGREIDILPPNIDIWEDPDTIEVKGEKSAYICKIAFSLTVEGLIESEIMQIFTGETVQEISSIMMGESIEEAPVETPVKEQTPVTEEVPTQQVVEAQPVQQTAQPKVDIQKPVFPQMEPSENIKKPRNLDIIMDVPLEFSVVLGKTKKTIREVLSFSNGSVIELNKLADEPLEIYVNGKLIAHGEVVVINENFGIRITNILSQEQRINNLR